MTHNYTAAFFFVLLMAGTSSAQTARQQKNGWTKYINNPVIGQGCITSYDVSVIRTGEGKYRMYCSQYEKGEAITYTESTDGLNWSAPVVCLTHNTSGGYNRQEDDHINRPSVIRKGGKYYMWYSHQDPLHSWIRYAVSNDGINWERRQDPVLSADKPWEKEGVLNAHVNWDQQAKVFKMWYSAGNIFEPDAIGYATSRDGIHWEKNAGNPVFSPDRNAPWEQAKVSGCQVIRRESDYLMFYIGYSDAGHAQIGMAKSVDGITGWQRCNTNPVLSPGIYGWDCFGVYKPFALPDAANNRWLLYYNGRHGWTEQVGIAVHPGMDLGF